MKSMLLCVVFAATVFAVSAGDKECYNYEELTKGAKATCQKCKKDPAGLSIDMCMYKDWNMTDENGNVPVSKLKESYIYGLDENKKEAVMNAIKDCGKDQADPLKDSKEINAFWKCSDGAVMKVCSEYAERVAEWMNDEELKNCFIY